MTTSNGDAIRGCILGGAIGDAMGGPFEACSGPLNYAEHGDWQVSDDSQLTLATCESITYLGGLVSPEHLAATFLTWYRQRRISGMGASTLQAMRSLEVGAHWWQAGATGEMAAGNGAAMRAAPLAFCLDPSTETGRRTLRDVCAITHRNDEAYIGALAVVQATHIAVEQNAGILRHLMEELPAVLPDSRTRDRINEIRSRAGKLSIEEVGVRFGCSGYVVESVPFALYAAQFATDVPFDQLLRSVVQAGGDADTTASIVGQVAGTFLGGSRLPLKDIGQLPANPPILEIAERFAAALD